MGAPLRNCICQMLRIVSLDTDLPEVGLELGRTTTRHAKPVMARLPHLQSDAKQLLGPASLLGRYIAQFLIHNVRECVEA